MSQPGSRVSKRVCTLSDLLRRRSLEHPERLLFTFLRDGETEEATSTCAGLDRDARAIAALLHGCRASVGERALLLYPPGLDFIRAFFGCLHAGVVAVPAYPPRPGRRGRHDARLASIAADAAPRFVLTTDALLRRRPTLEAGGLSTLEWLATDRVDADLTAIWRPPAIDAGTLAFLQYTSGSTAEPKGVRVTHGQLLHNQEMIRRAFGSSAETVVVGWLPLYHDMGLIGNVLQPLYAGGSCVLMSPMAFLQRPRRWLEAIGRYRATISGGPDFAYDLCRRKIAPPDREGLDLSSWRVAFDGAEPVRAATLQRFADAFAPHGFSPRSFFPCYGLAEATLFVSGKADLESGPVVRSFVADALEEHRVVEAEGEDDARELVGCGRALDQRLEIVDPLTRRRRSPDRIGEIWIAGGSVANGYWRRPETTTEVFAAELDEETDSSERFLRTGDLGFLRDGELFVTGRLKDLIILRGRNLYPQDIEATVERAHPALRAGGCAAFSVEAGGSERLVVVQELERRADLSSSPEDAIRQAVAEEHEVRVWDVALIEAGTLLKTSSGKVRRGACRTAYLEGELALVRAAEGAAAAPDSPPPPTDDEDLVELIRVSAARCLGSAVEAVAADRPLTSYGLDSLAAIELRTRLEDELGGAPSLAEILDGASAAELARQLAGDVGQGRAEGEAPAQAQGEAFALSHGQRALWLLHQVDAESPAYNLALALCLPPATSVDRLSRVLDRLVERHPMLRTVFLPDASLPDARGPRQRVLDDWTLPLRLVRSAGWSRARLERRLAALADEAFDLEREPPLRAHLFADAAGGSILFLTLHHLIADFWSLDLMVRDLQRLWTGATLPPTSSYAAFVDSQRRLLDGEEGARQLAFWRQELAAPLPATDLPVDRPRPPRPSFRGGRQRLDLTPLLPSLQALAAAEGTTLYTLVLTAFHTLVARLASSPQSLIGQPVAGRTRGELAEVVGCFVNPVVSRVELRRHDTAADLLQRVRRGLLAALGHQDLPFSVLVEQLQLERDPSRHPLFQVALSWQRRRWREPGEGGEGGEGPTLIPELSGQRGAPYDLLLMVGEEAPRLRAELLYSADLFEPVTAVRLLHQLRRLLAAFAERPQSPVQGLPLLGAGERHQLLEEWNDVPDRRGEAGTVLHQLFERQVRERPQAIATSGDGLQLSYREAGRRAGRLAARLRDLGVEPEARVALACARGPEWIVAALAVLRAGGAYLPLDLSYPEKRLSFIVAGAAVVIVDREGAQVVPEVIAPRLDLSSFDVDAQPPCPPVAVDPANAAYVFYTSGSTGRPKGVLVIHRAAVTLALASRHVHSRPGDRVGQLTSLAFDASAFEIWTTLARGAELHVVPAGLRRSPRELADHLIRHRVLHQLLVTPILDEVARQVPDLLRRLRCVWFGGEAGDARWLARLRRHAPGCRLVNLYGPTETTTVSTWGEIESIGEGDPVPIGRPFAGLRHLVLDPQLRPAALGAAGELFLGGEGLARGYLERPALTASSFLPDPHGGPGERLYRTGDLVRALADGRLVFLRRLNQQVKIRGHRVELQEIETALAALSGVEAAVAVLERSRQDGDARLVAYLIPAGPQPSSDELRAALAGTLPSPMIPAAYVFLDAFPLTPNGKVDRAALAAAPSRSGSAASKPPVPAAQSSMVRLLGEIWRQVLDVEAVAPDDNFFDLGGHSLAMSRVQAELEERLGRRVPIAELFQHPTLRSLSVHLERRAPRPATVRAPVPAAEPTAQGEPIAVVAMACRLPGAADTETFWRHLRGGVELISRFDAAELLAAGVSPELLEDPRFVRAGGVVEDADLFDAAFFGFNPVEAALLDPQQRIFLECAWQALELAGRAGGEGDIGVFAGMGENPGWNPSAGGDGSAGLFQQLLGRGRDFLPTRTSYLLGLNGPSVNVQSACSTSLVAVHLACQSLRAGECALALAGGVAIRTPQKTGYLYQPGMILSPDGRCRAFDAAASGTVGGNGAGVVVLKPLAAALADGDPIRAVIRGSAMNNDGARRVGYTAPGVEGQRQVIAAALAAAAVDPETIAYVETHGTGTEMGDPIEVSALTQAYRVNTSRRRFCALGSVKTNVGHLDAAAGIAGLIKAVLAVERGEIPPSLNFERPNPEIDFDRSPFFVNSTLRPWPQADHPRRAGVSSFGMGGTNVHLILEQAPEDPVREPETESQRADQLLLLSARTPAALDASGDALAHHLERSHDRDRHPGLADIAYTLQVGRRAFEHRRALVAADRESAARALAERDPLRVHDGRARSVDGGVTFVFAGLGDHYPGMSADLYRSESVYRDEIDRCAAILRQSLGLDLRQLLYAEDGRARSTKPDLRRMLGRGAPSEQAPASALDRTLHSHVALFAVEYALARLWMSWGVEPAAMLGYSLGEVVAATLAGVFSLEDGLRVVVERARRVEAQPEGRMLAVALSPAAAAAYLGGGVELAAVNGPLLSVLAGPLDAVAALEETLAGDGVIARRLDSRHPFHTKSLAPAGEALAELLREVPMQAPQRPYLSNLTGGWITPEQATDPRYWARHLCEPVLFADAVGELLGQGREIFLEIGPGQGLSSLVLQHPGAADRTLALPTLPARWEGVGDRRVLLTALGRLWTAGVEPDWRAVHGEERRRRVALPTYPFERRRFAVEVTAAQVPGAPARDEGPRLRVLLPEDAPAPAPGDRASRPPQTGTERRVAALWRDLLGVEQVGAEQSFFELGGHSLLGIQLLTRVRETLGQEVALADFFAAPTVAALAAALERGSPGGEGEGDLPAVTPRPEHMHEPFPLTEIQQAYWLGRGGDWAIGNVGAHAYLELETPELDPERFSRAWRRLIDRHPMLRMVVTPDGRQQILADAPVAAYRVAVSDLRGIPPQEAGKALATVRAEMSHQVHRTDRWPLFDNRLSLLDGHSRYHFSFDVILGDAWSLVLLDRDLWRLYRDPDLELPPLELTFRDYVLAETEIESSPRFQSALEYWRARLDDLPPAPDLPLVADPSRLTAPRFVRRRHRLPTEVWQRLQEQGRRRDLTPTSLLLAVFAEVLASWSRRPHFCLTLTLFNRHPLHPEVGEVVGDFTSLILLEVDAREPASFLERARQLQRRLWRDLDHRWVSGVRVLRELGRARGRQMAGIPVVFTSGLSLTAVETESAVERREVYGVSQTPQVWIDHQVYEEGGDLICNWDAVEDLFPPGMLDELSRAWVRLTEELLRDPAWEAPPRLTPEDHLERVAELNETAPVPVDEPLLHSLFARQAARTPEAPAVISAGRDLTYRELLQLAADLGGRLRARGARPGELVAVLLEKGWEQVVAVLGILASGAAYLPIDPALGARRRAHLLERGAVRLAVTVEGLAAGLETEAVTPVWVEDPDAAPGSTPWPEPVQAPDDLAYVIYTSGSTGEPKGVMISHRSAVNTVLDVNQRFALGAGDRVLALASLSFDLSVWDVFGLLACGGALVIPEPSARREPGRWLHSLRRGGVTVWNTVPALMEMLVEHARHRTDELAAVLRLVLLSGDWIEPSLPRRVRTLFPAAEVVSLGGATEASIWSILYPVPTDGPVWDGAQELASIPYGKPMRGQSVRVLDADLQPRPPWVAGEIWIGGLGVALGYWRDPERTAASFVVDPASGERLYRTGDHGRYLDDGNIEFLGREDDQVKIQGHRIELGEIEAVLAAHPRVRSAVAVAVGDGLDRRLVGFLTVEQTVDEAELHSYLAQRLPEPMIPRAFISLDAIPLTANGKVDRAALAARSQLPQSAAERGHVEPRDEVEATLAALWRELLEVPKVGVHDSFLELGGHSLTATRLVSRIRQTLAVELPLAALFEAPTIAELATRLGAAEAEATLPDIEPQPRERPLPLSFAQERLWFLHQMDPMSTAYSVPAAYRLRGAVRLAALEAALDRCVARHETLRTRFAVADGRPVQRIVAVDAAAARCLHVDLTAVENEERQGVARGLLEREASRPFALDGPLLRCLLLHLAGDDHVLFLNLHHIVCDGWSVDVLRRELLRFYLEITAPAGSPAKSLAPRAKSLAPRAKTLAPPAKTLAPPTKSLAPRVQYADYALWQRALLGGEEGVFGAQMEYWRSRLADEPPLLELPFDRPRPAVMKARAGRQAIVLDAPTAARLDVLGREHGASLFMVLLAGFVALLGRYTAQTDLAVGTPVAGRRHRQVEELIGFFVNTLVIRAGLERGQSFADLLRHVRALSLAAFSHQDLPFEKIVEELRPRRDPGRNPFFQVLFALQEAPGAVELPGLHFETLDLDQPRVRCDLELHLWSAGEGEGVTGELLYSRDLFDPTTVARLGRHLVRLIRHATADPSLPIARLPLLTPGEEQQLREENDRPARCPDTSIADHFAAQTAATPDAVALVHGEREISYRELAARAATLARRLRRAGVGPETLVGCSTLRRPRMVVRLLAILEAGAAYLPLDPDAPAERLRHLVEQSRAAALLLDREQVGVFTGSRLPTIDDSVESFGSAPLSGAGQHRVPAPVARPLNLAYVLYTSGSTGEPKGVAVPHRAVMRLVAGDDFARLDAGETLLQLAPVSFDASTLEIWGALLNGGRLVLMPPGPLSFDELGTVLERQRITTLWLTSALFRSMVEARPASLRSLRQLLAGGDVLSPSHVQRAADLAGVVINGYGPTENTTFTTCHPFDRRRDADARTVPIGRPIAGTGVHLVDPELQPVPLGVAGELLIGGEGLARGYLHRPAQSAEVFIPDPFSEAPSRRLYRSGDLVRRRPDGRLEFLRRRDQQLKIRGFRIEPGEIEHALQRHPRVEQAVVQAVGVAPEDRQLVAWVRLCGRLPEPQAELEPFLKQRLPAYMVPATIVEVDAFPLTGSGKIDRRVLLDQGLPALPRRDSGAGRAMSALERQIATVCEGVLGVEGLGPDDNFFDDLGAHSLLLAMLQIKLRDRGFEISVSDLFQAPSVAGLVAVLERRARATAADPASWPDELICLQPAEGSPRPPLFLLHALGGHVFFYRDMVRQLAPDLPVYAIQARGLSGEEEGAETLEELVAHYTEIVLGVQPHGPYHLAGCSLGGILSFEMANQLRDRGREVAFVGLIDSPGPGDILPAPADDAEALERFYRAERPFDLERFRRLDLEAQMREYIEVLMLHGDLPKGIEMSDCYPILRLATALAGLAHAYRPRPYPGTLHFYRAATRYDHDPEHPEVPWIERSQGAVVHIVPGDHVSMMRSPQVETLGALLGEHLERVRQLQT